MVLCNSWQMTRIVLVVQGKLVLAENRQAIVVIERAKQ